MAQWCRFGGSMSDSINRTHLVYIKVHEKANARLRRGVLFAQSRRQGDSHRMNSTAVIKNLLEGSRLIARQRAWARFGWQAANSFGASRRRMTIHRKREGGAAPQNAKK